MILGIISCGVALMSRWIWSLSVLTSSIDQVVLSAMFWRISSKSSLIPPTRTGLRYFVQKTIWYWIEYALVLVYDTLLAVAIFSVSPACACICSAVYSLRMLCQVFFRKNFGKTF